MSRELALIALTKAFHGELEPELDWSGLLQTANEALVTPSLHQALRSKNVADQVPPEAEGFFALIDERNFERNLRLRAMAYDAIAALNSAGIMPVLLKGMAVWASAYPGVEHLPRMMSDVDLLVQPDEAPKALKALRTAGFRLLEPTQDSSPHGVAELWREGDVGALDLHKRPPGSAGLVGVFDPVADGRDTSWPGQVRAPSPAHQIYLTCIHDMFHDGGFWRGGFDVRHLCDIADLARTPGAVDWAFLTGLAPTRLARNAVISQLIAAHHIVGAEIPKAILRELAPRLHYQRHRAQYGKPGLFFPLAILGLGLEAFNLGQHGRKATGGASLSSRVARLQRMANREKIVSHPNKL